MPEEQWDTVIKPKTGWFDINLKELWKYRDLVFLFVRRTFVSHYKQTVLGPLWAIIQPLLMTVVFTVIFGNIAGMPTDGIPPFLFFMSGNIAWSFFSSCLTQTAATFTSNSNIFGKVYFPRLVMPISTVISTMISFAIQIIFFIFFYVIYIFKPDAGFALSPVICFFPVFILQFTLLGLGFGVVISALTTKYRDLVMLIGFGVQLWMYATPVAYASSIVPQKWLGLYCTLNPVTPVIEGMRYALFGVGTFSLHYWFISLISTVLVVFSGVVLFSRAEKTFVDTV